MLRYQQTYSFFDPAKVDDAIHFTNLSREALAGNLDTVLERIVRAVEEQSPAFVVVDSFRTLARAVTAHEPGELQLQEFVQRLALYLTGWQATTFLVGEYTPDELENNPISTVADGIFWLAQSIESNSVVRKLQVVKIRGQEHMPGLHTFRITDAGLQVYPRIPLRVERIERPTPTRRLSTGVTGLDEMLGGGIPVGDSVILGGPSGAGKSVLATQFIAEGIGQGEPGVIAVFEEHPEDYLRHARELGFDLEGMIGSGQLQLIYLHPLDLSVDETLQAIQDAVNTTKARRVVIDSISGFQLTLAPTFREDFRESLYRLAGALTGAGITILMTVEVVESFSNLHFSAYEVSFLADDLLYLRYVELRGHLQKVIMVVKMRSSAHSTELREYQVTAHGVEIGRSLADYRGIMTGQPQLIEGGASLIYPGLSAEELLTLQTLIALGETTAVALGAAIHLRRPALDAALERLVTLNYAVRVTEKRRTVYRPVSRMLA
jgi:circadian clock protein KaiC